MITSTHIQKKTREQGNNEQYKNSMISMHSWLKTKKTTRTREQREKKLSLNSMHSWLKKIKPRDHESKEKN